jgi:NADH dehydrogenase
LVAKPEDLQALMNFVIVGGGPTGVELAGALAEMKKNILPKDYPDKDFRKLTVYLIEGSSNVLKPMSSDSQKKALLYLLELDVVVKTNTVVTNYDGFSVDLNNGEIIASKNVIWAAGITGTTLDGIPEEAITRGNRIIVNRKCEITALKDVYAIGDISFMETPKYPKGHPQVASVAIEHSKFLADNFKLISENKPLLDFEYHDKGAMATIGKRKAVVDLPKFSFQGRVAWFVWMLVHLVMILNLKNKISIFINWIFSYFNNDSTLRVLIKPLSEKKKE